MNVRKKTFLMYLLFFIISISALLFIILPLTRLLFFISPQTAHVIKEKNVLMSIFNSISLSFITAIFSFFIGVPLAFMIVKNKFKFLTKYIETIIDMPIAIPHTVVGIALLFVYGKNEMIGALTYHYFNLRITGTRIAIVIAMTFVSFPYMIDSLKEGFKSIDPSLEKAARILGASEFSVFKTIYMPLSKNFIFSGFLLVWARAISEFGAVVMLAYYPLTAPVEIYNAFNEFNIAVSGTIAAYLLIVCLSIFISARFILDKL